MLALIEEQTAPERAAKANGALTEDIIINPYDIPSEAPALPSTPSRFESPRKVQLRSSTSTPKRGAAAKLDASKGRMLSPYERLSGVKQWEAPAKKQGQPTKETEKEPEDESMEIEEVVTERSARKNRKSSPPPAAKENDIPAVPKRVEFAEPEPFKPFPVPSIETPSRPLPSFGFSPTTSETFASPSQESALASSTRKEPTPAFMFKPSKPAAPREDASNVEATPAEKEQPKKPSTSTFDPTKVFLSARDTALAIAKPALPFFTFTISSSAKDDAATAKAKEQAQKAAPPTFNFTLPSPTSSTSAATATATTPTHGDEQWECDTCMLKNPGTAKEKCTICETPRPTPKAAAASAAPAAPTASAAPAAAHGDEQWECDTCMLKNPGTAEEKCTICEAPRPPPKASGANGTASKTASATVATPAPTPFQWPTGMAPQKKEGWTCGTCMCSSPESATKCVVCETPRGA
jgi:nuclear pore complex protein Nup153